MRHLTAISLAAAGLAAALAVPSAAAPPMVGGPRKASVPISFTAAGPQQHFLAETFGDITKSVDPVVDEACKPPRCHAFPFRAAPTKRTDKSIEVSARVSWAMPTSRFWLSIVDVTKPADPVTVAQCFTFYVAAGSSASVQTRLPVNRRWAVWVSVEQVLSTSEKVTGAIQSPPKNGPKTSALGAAPPEAQLFLHPCQT